MKKRKFLERILIKFGGLGYTNEDLKHITDGNKKIPKKELLMILLAFLLPILLFLILIK